MNISNANILLTGAGGGIGSSLLSLLIAKNAHVVAITRNPNSLQAIKDKSGYSDQQLTIIAADLNSTDGRTHILNKIHNASLKINMLINCAGCNQFASLASMNDDQIIKQIFTNLMAPILLTKDLLPILQQRDYAHIINIGSSFDSIGFPGFAVYNASKFGLRGFTESLRRELANTNIAVTLVSPRATKTKMNSNTMQQLNTALGNKSDDTDYVAEKIIQAIEKSKKEVYLGWPERLFTRINRIIPSIVDSALKKQLPIIQKYL